MSQTPETRPRIAVIGGGITGLAAAHRLLELRGDVDLHLLEAANRVGGVLDTVRRDGLLIERSADGFITNLPWGVDLCRRIGMGDQLLSTNKKLRKVFVVYRGRLVELPQGFLLMAPTHFVPVLTTPLLTLRGKMRLGCELFVPRRREEGDESMASFVRRRLGRETYERIVQPLLGGIYTADPEKLSIEATMPQFVAMERKYGGLIRGARRRLFNKDKSDQSSSGARFSLFTTPRDGMSSLIATLVGKLPPESIRLDTPVAGVAQAGEGKWNVTVGPDGKQSSESFDAVIVATPAPKASRLVEPADPQLAAELSGIEYTGTAVVSVAYRREQIAHALDGFGFVVPAIENRRILAGSFSSNKYEGRAPDGTVLLRVFVGGACQGELAQLPDDDLKSLVAEEFAELLGAVGEPVACEISRWTEHMAQYHVGHIERVARIERRVGELPNLELAGNAYHGVGVPYCIRSGEQAAERVLGVEGE